MSDTPTPTSISQAAPPHIREVVITLFELGREVTSVLDLDELLEKIPQLIARLIKFQAFAVYLLDAAGEELHIAYSVGYPDDCARTLRMKVGQGLVGAAVADGAPVLVNDVRDDPLVDFELGDAVDQEKWIAMRQNLFDRRVVERQR